MSVATVVHESTPVAERWNATEARPEPPVSAALADSVTEALRYCPGSSCVAVGASESIPITFADA